jgi:hypothetical protein
VLWADILFEGTTFLSFSKIKVPPKNTTARTLIEAIGGALEAITTVDMAEWFTHCSYEVRDQRS